MNAQLRARVQRIMISELGHDNGDGDFTLRELPGGGIQERSKSGSISYAAFGRQGDVQPRKASASTPRRTTTTTTTNSPRTRMTVAEARRRLAERERQL
jgi:hypothetical protein